MSLLCENLKIRGVVDRELTEVINLHQLCFPGYFSTIMGPHYLRILYSTFIREKGSMALGAFSGGQLVGIAAGELNREAFFRELVGRNFFRLALLTVFRFFTSSEYRKLFWKRSSLAGRLLRMGLSGESDIILDDTCPHRLVSLAVKEEFRQRRVGKTIVEEFCRRMRQAGADCVGLSVHKDNASAIDFYERNGWVRESETMDAIYYRMDLGPRRETLELEAIRDRYLRRASSFYADLYSPLLPQIFLTFQERERAIIRWIRNFRIAPVALKRVLEVGCGEGNNLLNLIRLGFSPSNLVGNELLGERAERARCRLPAVTQIIEGDASEIDLSIGPFDVILQFAVFTSILNEKFQEKLANRLWSLVKPGGGILWYDFIYNNPRNPDVRGIPIKRIKELFPEAQIKVWRVTLAPPISRFVTRIHPSLYTVFNLFPLLRTHVLCWIERKEGASE